MHLIRGFLSELFRSDIRVCAAGSPAVSRSLRNAPVSVATTLRPHHRLALHQHHVVVVGVLARLGLGRRVLLVRRVVLDAEQLARLLVGHVEVAGALVSVPEGPHDGAEDLPRPLVGLVERRLDEVVDHVGHVALGADAVAGPDVPEDVREALGQLEQLVRRFREEGHVGRRHQLLQRLEAVLAERVGVAHLGQLVAVGVAVDGRVDHVLGAGVALLGAAQQLVPARLAVLVPEILEHPLVVPRRLLQQHFEEAHVLLGLAAAQLGAHEACGLAQRAVVRALDLEVLGGGQLAVDPRRLAVDERLDHPGGRRKGHGWVGRWVAGWRSWVGGRCFGLPAAGPP